MLCFVHLLNLLYTSYALCYQTAKARVLCVYCTGYQIQKILIVVNYCKILNTCTVVCDMVVVGVLRQYPVTVGVGHSQRYCITGYDQSQGMRPSTLKCIGPISKGDIEPNHPSEINPNSDSRSRSDGRSRRFVQYRVEQSQDRDQDHFSRTVCDMSSQKLYMRSSALIRIFVSSSAIFIY